MSLTDRIGLAGFFPGIAGARLPKDFFIDGDDFTKTPVDDEDYAFTNATVGTMALAAAGENGVLLLDAASTTATQGAQMQRPAASFLPKAGRHILFSARLKITDTYDKCEFFAGLAEIDTTIIGTSAVSTANHIAFSCVTDDGVLLSNCEKAGAGATTTGYTLVEDTYLTLGIHVHELSKVEFSVNGVIKGIISTTANIPIVGLSPSFVCQSGGTNDPIMSIDYWVCAQDR